MRSNTRTHIKKQIKLNIRNHILKREKRENGNKKYKI